MRSRREKNPIANVQSLFMSEVTEGLTSVEQGLTSRFHVNICDYTNYIPKKGPAPLHLFPALPLSGED